MKILHTSDWHLGKRLGDFSRIDEQREVLAEICRIADDEDARLVIVAGDLFDTWNPPVEAIELYYHTLKQLSNGGERMVAAIAGNHDSPERIEAPEPLAREHGILFAGYPHTRLQPFVNANGNGVFLAGPGYVVLNLKGIGFPVNLLLTPYASEQRMKTFLGYENPEEVLRQVLADHWARSFSQIKDNGGIHLFAGHFYMVDREGPRPEEPLDEEKPIITPGGLSEIFTENLPAGIQYAAIGHLHRRQIVGEIPCPVVYSGSPLSYSFSEAHQTKSVEIVEIRPGESCELRQVNLKSGYPLVRKRFDSTDEAMAWLPLHTACYLELTVRTETYLNPEAEREFRRLHPRIVSLIPEIRLPGEAGEVSMSLPDPTAEMEPLFIDYFRRSRGGAAPDEATLDLFREILATEEDEL
jgi:exonuclease SbcD